MIKKRKLMARVRATRRRLALGPCAALVAPVVTITPWEARPVAATPAPERVELAL